MSDLDPWIKRLPLPGQTCVFTHGYSGDAYFTEAQCVAHWKRDALLFDRVYAKGSGLHPPDIPIEVSFGSDTVEREMLSYDSAMSAALAQAYGNLEEIKEAFGDGDPVGFDIKLADEYAKVGVMGEWSYASTGAYLRRFGAGEKIAYEGALSNIPLVTVGSASWDQILDFRSDAEAVRKYRDLRLWLRSGLKAESAQHAADIIGQKIDDYAWAIKRHGLQTSLGAFKTIFDWKESKLMLAATGLAAITGGPVWGVLAGGLSVAVQIGAYLTERRLDAKDTARGANREVAILYEVQQQFKG